MVHGAVELIEDRLYVLGDEIHSDGRVSWLPANGTSTSWINAYLIRDEASSSALMIDTGVAAHRDAILNQTKELLSGMDDLSVFLTRSEEDCLGNLLAIASELPLRRVYAGGNLNPFDFFDDIKSMGPDGPTATRVLPGRLIAITDSLSIEVLATPLRLITTFWVYESSTETLFTSDAFGYSSSNERVVRSAIDAGDPTDVRRHLFSRFRWVKHASHNVEELHDRLAGMFSEREVAFLAPTHGPIMAGRDAVDSQLTAVLRILEERMNETIS